MIEREYAALNRHDVDAVFADYADTLSYGDLGDTSLAKRTTKAALKARIGPFLAANPRLHLEVPHEIAFGPFVIAHEAVSGAADGKPLSILDISDVRNGRVVAELEVDFPTTPTAMSSQAASTARMADEAFARHAPEAAMQAYAETVLDHVWGEDSIRHLTKAALTKGFHDAMTANPHMRFAVLQRFVVGPYVVVHEQLSGMADGKRLEAFDVMEVRAGRIVVEWECPWVASSGER